MNCTNEGEIVYLRQMSLANNGSGFFGHCSKNT